MLSDPLSITYNPAAKSLPRVSSSKTTTGASSVYRTADGEFELTVDRTARNGVTRTDIMLVRVTPDPSPGAGHIWNQLPNGFGISYLTNDSSYAEAVDIPLLRAALLSFVDTTVQSRLLGGEV